MSITCHKTDNPKIGSDESSLHDQIVAEVSKTLTRRITKYRGMDHCDGDRQDRRAEDGHSNC